MRVLFCGGRDFDDWVSVEKAFGEHMPTLCITGDAKGADYIADRVAERLGIGRAIFPANWKGDGRAAGPIRNSRMLEFGRPDAVVAFSGGRGTADMMAKARRAGVPVFEVDPQSKPQNL